MTDYTDPDVPIPDYQDTTSEWFTRQDPRLQRYRKDLWTREVRLARMLIARIDAGLMAPSEFSYRMTQLTYNDVKSLCQLELSIQQEGKDDA